MPSREMSRKTTATLAPSHPSVVGLDMLPALSNRPVALSNARRTRTPSWMKAGREMRLDGRGGNPMDIAEREKKTAV